ncbi:MAG: hypothetical protein DRJ03_03410 [Chloroflexi bacterium]|nr:MAG: hypothetical protein DRJ03_03410 [Chloroflexota bacterium]
MDKVCWSEPSHPEAWSDDMDVMFFFYVPKKWWSIKAWKFALEFRAHMNKRLVQWYGDHAALRA